MSEFLENLKARHAESQKRFIAKQQQLNAVNAEFQAVAQEFNAWTTLLNLEARKEQAAAIAPAAPVVATPQKSAIPALPSAATPPEASESNKTEFVRELLRQHSAGMKPSEIWKHVKEQIPRRPYLYSVLKRLKDRGDIVERRGKYIFKFAAKPEEPKENNLLQ
jgi:hypothetical protein